MRHSVLERSNFVHTVSPCFPELVCHKDSIVYGSPKLNSAYDDVSYKVDRNPHHYVNSEVDEDTRFRSEGGFKKIDRIFQNKLESIVLELNEYLYDDGGRSA